jgi:hypothetical protein
MCPDLDNYESPRLHAQAVDRVKITQFVPLDQRTFGLPYVVIYTITYQEMMNTMGSGNG